MELQTLLNKIRSYNPQADFGLIQQTYELGENCLEEQKRKSGDSYFFHACRVAEILAEIHADSLSIASALIHDITRKGGKTVQEIEKVFGTEISTIITFLNKLARTRLGQNDPRYLQNLRKVFLVLAKDLRVVLIRLADRVNNLETIESLSLEEQKWAAQKALDIYAPIADLTGVYALKWRIEDLAFKILKPEEYKWIAEALGETRKEREAYVQKICQFLNSRFREENIDTEVTGRPKHFYSIYKKSQRMSAYGGFSKKEALEQIMDKSAFMILVSTVSECYTVLAKLHQQWQQIPERFRDYISHPKPNDYCSLHTTVIGPEEKTIEIQIKTREMHEFNEFGPASHFFYKETGSSSYLLGGKKVHEYKPISKKATWVKQLLRLREEKDQSLSSDLFSIFEGRVFVFTPKGDVIELPKGSTPVDFAYAVHTDLGNRCLGAKVDGKMVSLNYCLQNGQICEILTSKRPKSPSPDWLEFAKTNTSKKHIRQSLKQNLDEEK